MKSKIVIMAVAAAMMLSLASCGGADSNTGSTGETGASSQTAADTASSDKASTDKDSTGAAAPGEEAGFEEIEIGEEQEIEVPGATIQAAAVYFQPVDMYPVGKGLSKEESNLHLEADIHILENELGFGVGDWIPYMTVKYEIIGSNGAVAKSGTFMEMNATDGPHYGANLMLENADTYTLKLTLSSPADNDYLLHVDAETGVTGRFWDEPLVIEFKDWDYTPQEW